MLMSVTKFQTEYYLYQMWCFASINNYNDKYVSFIYNQLYDCF